MSSPDPLVDRYGRPSLVRRRALVALVGVVALAGLVWLGWVVVFAGTPPVTSQLVGYRVDGEHAATGTFRVVRRDEAVRASCDLRALSVDRSIVGQTSVPVTSGPPTQLLDATLRTERRADSVQLLGCNTDDRPDRQ